MENVTVEHSGKVRGDSPGDVVDGGSGCRW